MAYLDEAAHAHDGIHRLRQSEESAREDHGRQRQREAAKSIFGQNRLVDEYNGRGEPKTMVVI